MDKSLMGLADIINILLFLFIIRGEPVIGWLQTRHNMILLTCDRTAQQSPPSQT